MIPPLVPRELRPDLAVFDSDERPVLLGYVKETIKDETKARDILTGIMRAAGIFVPFGLTTDTKTIQIFGWDGIELAPLVRFAAPEILTAYYPNFAFKRVEQDYLLSLVGRWLRDVSLHLTYQAPPAIDALMKVGLAERIAGGTTFEDHPID